MILEVVADMSQLQPLLHNAIMSNNDSFCDVRLEGSLRPLQLTQWTWAGVLQPWKGPDAKETIADGQREGGEYAQTYGEH